MKQFQDIESDVLDAVRDVMVDFAERIGDADLRVVLHPPRKANVDTSSYSSEIVIDFWDSKGIVDVLELHVVRDGHPVATVVEGQVWLRDELLKIVGG